MAVRAPDRLGGHISRGLHLVSKAAGLVFAKFSNGERGNGNDLAGAPQSLARPPREAPPISTLKSTEPETRCIETVAEGQLHTGHASMGELSEHLYLQFEMPSL